jgi:hypothetical protein
MKAERSGGKGIGAITGALTELPLDKRELKGRTLMKQVLGQIKQGAEFCMKITTIYQSIKIQGIKNPFRRYLQILPG